ncbi:homocysteine S-methyltransferase [Phaeosphaeria sp. MPI-PUGE-AT-0046c]|nr:homocysteine S-methyltransferase [Phaeosphaeria sp. MPI-PUGE-AT-0046c]
MSPTKISHHLTSTTSPLILDGALATYLETLGADISGALWSASILLSQPELIKQTHLDYYRAGANIAITASYQASIPGLVKHLGLSEDAAQDVVKKSVGLAQQARDECAAERMESVLRGNMYVAGSVGPYGAFLSDGSEYRGDYVVSKEEMKAFHRGRMQALVDAGVDLLACETIPSKSEAEALVELLTEEFEGIEAWFTFTLRDGEHIADGTPLVEIASLFGGVEQVVGVGLNCVPDDLALAALKVLKPLVKRGTLIVYPNSGEQWNAKAREWEGRRTEGSTLAHKTVEWWDAGARLIGGCCRTSPEDIKTMCEALRERR